MTTEAADPLLGTVLDGRYELQAVLGEGGIGRVYRALHLKLARPVAIKVLLDEHQDQHDVQMRFEREAKTLSALSHPHIVTITDFGVDGVPYLVMELAHGREVEALLQEGGIAPDRALRIFGQLLGCLGYAHEQGIVHRDLKPANMLLRQLSDGTDHLEVLDFGLAKFVAGAHAASNTKVTRIGTIVGTPAYMAPEQVDGSDCDGRADLYSAGVVLFELLCGRLPFVCNEASEMIRAHLATPPPTVSAVLNRPVSERAEAFFARALAKSPADRFPDARAMRAALNELDPSDFVRPEPRSAPRKGESTAPTMLAKGLSSPGGPPRVASPPTSVLWKTPDEWRQWSEVRGPLGLPRWILLIGALGTAVTLSLVLTFAFGSSEDPNVEREPQMEEAAVPWAVTPPLVARDRPEPHDPWVDALPAELRSPKSRLDEGRRLSRSQIGSLRSFHSNNPRDARPLLLIARAYVAKGWLSHALPMYEQAYQVDPRVRGDRRMLSDLVRIAAVDTLEEEGGVAVRTIYGEEAIPAITEAIGTERQAGKRERLERLRASLH